MVWVKRIGIVIATILALIIALIAYIVLFVDPNQFKGQLQQIAQEKADIELRLDGDLAWSFFPRIGLSLEDVGAGMTGEPELVSFSSAEVGVAVLPLFERRVEVTTVRLENLVADLRVDQNGQPNWQLQADTPPQATSDDKATTTSTSTSDAGSSSVNIPDIALDELTITNAQIHYEDARTDMQADVVANVTFNDVKLDQAWPMQMDAKITQSTLDGANPVSAALDFESNFTLFSERRAFCRNAQGCATEHTLISGVGDSYVQLLHDLFRGKLSNV